MARVYESDVKTYQPERLLVEIGQLVIVSDGPAAFDTHIWIDGKPLQGVQKITLTGSVDGVWTAEIKMILLENNPEQP